MRPILYRVSTQLKYQVPIALACVAVLAACIWMHGFSKVDLISLDRSTFITATSTVASLIALFCSLSIAWILFVSQQNKAERVTTYDLLKQQLLGVQQWLLGQPISDDRELCLALAFELGKHDISELPQVDWGNEYRRYCDALDSAFDGDDDSRRVFFLTSIAYFGYIEHLLSRIGLISIRQVIARLFIETLAKGISLVGLAVFILVISIFWYGNEIKPWLVLATSFTAISALLLLVEVWVDLKRFYESEIDFTEKSDDGREEV